MSTISGGVPARGRRKSDVIKLGASKNFHHGIRLAAALGFDLNQLVSINFSLTGCDPDMVDLAFAKVRAAFGKWARRPGKEDWLDSVPPTFVWVIENPNGNCINAHWMVHVPDSRLRAFTENLSRWLKTAVGEIYSEKAIDIRRVYRAMALEKYLLKGLHPSLAKMFRINHEHQGWLTGRRIGHSKNIGPVQVRLMRRLGQFKPAQRWR